MKFTVLLPVYNGDNAEHFQLALESILIQTLLPDELILLIDGKVNRGIEKVIKDFINAQTNIEIKIVRNKVNKGLGQTLRNGVLISNNEFIVRMDADDICEKSRFEIQMKYFSSQDIDILGGQIEEFNEAIGDLKRFRSVPLNSHEIRLFSKRRNPINHMTVCFKKSAILSIGNYEDVPGYEDYYLWMKALKCNLKVQNLNYTLVYARVKELVIKRQGMKFFKKEVQFQIKLFRNNLVTFNTFIVNVFIRALPRLLPLPLLNMVYNRRLRKVKSNQSSQ